jgi:chromosome partitioning protein
MTGIVIQNIKGGVGKTTTTLHLAADILRRRPKAKLLIIDCDQQASVSTYFRDRVSEPEGDLFDFLIEGREYRSCVGRVALLPNGEGVADVLPASKRLADVEIRLSTLPRREETLRRRLREDGVGRDYDYLLFDCPPTLNLLTYNVAVVCSYQIIPCNMDYLSLVGVQSILENLAMVEKYFGRKPHVVGILPTFFDPRGTVARAVAQSLEQTFGRVHPILSPIRVDSGLKKAQIRKETLFQYDEGSRAAEDYRKLGEIVLEAIDGHRASRSHGLAAPEEVRL